MRVAIIHDWLVTWAGSEKVLEQIIECFPQADVFSVVDFLSDSEREAIAGKHVTTTFIQKLPKARTHYQLYLPLMPLAIEQLDLSGYDLVLSSSHAVAKGVLTGPDQLHISYIHSPIRYAWDLQHQYLREAGLNKGIKSMLARMMMHYMRLWDVRTVHSVDSYVANSEFIKRRIQKAYGRQATVIYPPVDVSAFSFCEDKEDFYLTASRMVPYKKMSMIVEAFQVVPDKRLIVIGDGPEMDKCREKAGVNVEFLGWQPFDVLSDHMQRAKAFVFAAEEDFGITPVEAQACGTPVIAFGKGGGLESIRGLEHKHPTGLFFYEQTPNSLLDALMRFERDALERISNKACRENAMRFRPECFRNEFTCLVEKEIERFFEKKVRGNDAL
ncbi:glycosyltransferase family 4 protein [Prosthecochloris sp.]|uniref:glycosyltransferase family 4 protein n=1 Tax=Prosthecochloris sp. TaxID=290513 RepID=UPI0025796134|nr:glycosyltransferase family 4 protein [Prosthecochloris sp.]